MIMSIVDHVVVIDSSWISLRSSSSREGLPTNEPRTRPKNALSQGSGTSSHSRDSRELDYGWPIGRKRKSIGSDCGVPECRGSCYGSWFIRRVWSPPRDPPPHERNAWKKTITIGRRKSAEMTDSATGESCFLFFPGRMRVTQCGDARCRGCAQID